MIKSKLKKLGSVLITLLVILEVFVIVFIVFSKISGNVPSAFGYQMYVVVSPSMEPQIEVGDVIISKEYDGGELAVGDVVTYLGREGDMSGKMITHEIVRIDGDEIITKGLANNSEDPSITRDDVYSVMLYNTVVISAVYGVMTSTVGFICLVILPLLLMIVSEIVGMVIQIKKEGAKNDEEIN